MKKVPFQVPSRMRAAALLVAAAAMTCGNAVADQFHYNNILIGDRALGLGGAYTAMSDDSSGIFYNPAGLAFALSNDISGSANAFYWRKATYKKALGNLDFTERSQGSVPSFFGGLQKLDHIAKGLVFAFGVYSTDNELKDQNDLYKDLNINGIDIFRFHRSVQLRASTNYFGGGLGYRISPNFSVGFGMKYMMIDELSQEYQDIDQITTRCPDGSDSCDSAAKVPSRMILTQNIRQHLSASAIQPILGAQFAVGRFAFGLTLKKGILLSDELDTSFEKREVYFDSGDSVSTSNPDFYKQTAYPSDPGQKPTENALGALPLSTRLGMAWFASPRFLVTADAQHYQKVSSGKAQFAEREAVLNMAAGMEFYATPSMPVRFAYFQNNDARPEIDKNKAGQADHIDYDGFSTFVGWVQPNSQVSFGGLYQIGHGEAQKLGDSQIQTVEASSITLAFSATHNF